MQYLSNYLYDYDRIGGAIVAFSLEGMDPLKHTIEGYMFNPDTKEWEQGVYSYPAAVFKTIYLNKSWRNHFQTIFGNRLFNSYVFNKWEMYKWECKGMKTVRVMKIVSNDETHLRSLDELMRVFGSAKRYAFNRLLEGRNAKEIIKHLPHQFRLNKRFAEDAVLLAQSLISSQRELLPIRLEDVQAKIEKTEKKIDEYQHGRKTPKNIDLQTCLRGLHQRLEKLKAKEAELKHHLDQGTIPRVIFGGKENFYKRLKGKITNEEWKDLRSNQLYEKVWVIRS